MIRAAVALALMAGPAAGQSLCDDRAALHELLRAKYRETLIFVVILSETHVGEVWLSPDGKTFSFVQTDALGKACIVQTGGPWWTDQRLSVGAPG